MRVYELAEALNTTSGALLRKFAAMGIEAHSPLSRLDVADSDRLRAAWSKKDAAAESDTPEKQREQRENKANRARERREVDARREAETLKAGIERARELEARVKGVAPPSEEAPPPSEVPEPEAAPEPVGKTTPAKTVEPKTPATPRPSRPPPAPAVHAKPEEDDGADDGYALKAPPVRPKRAAVRPPPSARDTDMQRQPPPPRGASQRGRGARAAAPAPRPMAQGRGKPVAASGSAPVGAERTVYVRGSVIVKDLAEMLGLRANQIIAELMHMNVLASINQRVEFDLAKLIAERHGFRLELERQKRSVERRPALRREDEHDDIPEDQPDQLEPRPPVVTFLGHVDHGKTSLLDRICNKRVASGEEGGITQHMGAYTVDAGGRAITFLDTPGHAAFSAMRARGANLTDIAVIIIAADDGIMPQTREAIKHARQAGVTIMVAINKIDLPAANADRTRQQLQGDGLTPEEWGGDTICCEVSAISGQGVDHLLEMILLQADVLELSANPNRRANGYVVEARLEQGRGPTATLLVTGGTLNVGDVLLCAPWWGRVRALVNDQGRLVKSAGPGVAVQCLGLSGVPEAGAQFRVMLNEKRARMLAEQASMERKSEELTSAKAVSVDDLMRQISDQGRSELSVILKADTQGSVEAVADALKEIRSEKVTLNLIQTAIGNVTATDVQRAASGDAMIVGFHAMIESGVQALARHHGVRILSFRIIYELIDAIRQEMLNLIDPEFREIVRGNAEVRQVFSLTRKGTVAGCLVTRGVIRTDGRFRVLRGKTSVFDGRITSLRHFQDEVASVREAQECGIMLDGFQAFEVGDIIECYAFEELERAL